MKRFDLLLGETLEEGELDWSDKDAQCLAFSSGEWSKVSNRLCCLESSLEILSQDEEVDTQDSMN